MPKVVPCAPALAGTKGLLPCSAKQFEHLLRDLSEEYAILCEHYKRAVQDNAALKSFLLDQGYREDTVVNGKATGKIISLDNPWELPVPGRESPRRRQDAGCDRADCREDETECRPPPGSNIFRDHSGEHDCGKRPSNSNGTVSFALSEKHWRSEDSELSTSRLASPLALSKSQANVIAVKDSGLLEATDPSDEAGIITPGRMSPQSPPTTPKSCESPNLPPCALHSEFDDPASRSPTSPEPTLTPELYAFGTTSDTSGPCSRISSGLTGGSRPKLSITAGHEQLKMKYMAIFDEAIYRMDLGDEGELPIDVLRQALRSMGEQGRARKLISSMDRNGDGVVDRGEWEVGVDEILEGKGSDGTDFLENFMDRIDQEAGRAIEQVVGPRDPCLINHTSKFRIAWDIFVGILLLHVALVLPLEIGYVDRHGGSSRLVLLGLVIDAIFMADVILNFRTTYSDYHGRHVTNGTKIARHYLRTWFTIDLVSSVPFEHVSSGIIPSLNMSKLARSGKIFKLLKMLRFAKASRFSERISDYLAVSGGTLLLGMVLVINAVLLLCHWLACFMPLVGDGFLEAYAYTGQSIASEYCVAVYWAVTTITTVGYGDVLPTSDAERLYTISAMLIGGGLYSCVIGNVFVILNNRNLNAQICIQRLREVLEFLDHHKLPKQLRHRVWHYHRKHLKGRSSSDRFSVLGDLSPELRQAVSFVIVHEDVRSNPLFHDLPSIVILFLASVIKNISGELGDIVASHGDYAFSMSVIIEGSAVMDTSGERINTHEEAMALSTHPAASQVMLPGDSFGEEILLGITRTLSYNVIACNHVLVSQIPAEEFMMHFQSMPDILQRMQANWKANGGVVHSREGTEEW